VAELVPIPFGQLLRRVHYEFDRRRAIFDLPERKFYRRPSTADTCREDAPGLDLSVSYAGSRAANPVGPAAGPHTQLAQNIALCWLAGARVIELKTVQVNDRLTLSRPCIDMATVGYNTEWSQELRLEDSLREYVKASMLIELLGAAGVVDGGDLPFDAPPSRLAQGKPGPKSDRDWDSESGDWKRVVFDISVGYDLQGIRSPTIVRWLESMRDAGVIVDELRAEIPAEFAHLRDLPFRTAIGTGITLSTFHGTPADEIERIGEFLIGELGFHTVIKLNPPMLGRDRVDHILHDVLGYDDVTVNPAAYERSLAFGDAVGVVRRLEALAARRGASVGVKCGNTLEVLNTGSFLKEPVQYLSGQPLHALHVALVQRWREVFGAGLQISFSAGVDAHNVADCVAAGLVPVTTCTDLLRAGGYGRLARYITNLEARMREVGARTIPEFIERTAATRVDAGLKSCSTTEASPPASCDAGLKSCATTGDSPPASCDAGLKSCATTPSGAPASEREGALAAGAADASSVVPMSAGHPPVVAQGFSPVMTQSVLRNTEALLEQALTSERYRSAQNRKAPRKLGTHLWLWDCISCSKCIPACPNDAVFEIEVDPFVGDVPVIAMTAGGWREVGRRLYRTMKPTQIAIFADACNDCGNCDVFCPEDGGPYIEKPRFFGSLDAWRRAAPLTGFVLAREDGVFTLLGRLDEDEFALSHRSASNVATLEHGAATVIVDWNSHEILSAGVISVSAGLPSRSLRPGKPRGDEGEQTAPRAGGPERPGGDEGGNGPPRHSPGASLRLGSGQAAPGSPKATGASVVDLSAYMTLRILLDALMRPHRVNFVNAAFVE
jgi:putative selenate reductase